MEIQIICQTGSPNLSFKPAPLYWATKTSEMEAKLIQPTIMDHAKTEAFTLALWASKENWESRRRSTKTIIIREKEESIRGTDIVHNSRKLPWECLVNDIV